MSKPIHPIRKLRVALERSAANAMPYDGRELEPVIARHVKPLLDALEELEHKLAGDHEYCDDSCEVKRASHLLAAWRAKP